MKLVTTLINIKLLHCNKTIIYLFIIFHILHNFINFR